MKSDLPKVVHEVCGLPLIAHVVRQVKKVGIKKIIVVVGYQKKRVIEALSDVDVEFVTQTNQLGTGHAVLVCEKKLRSFRGNVLVLDGDVLFEETSLLKKFYADFKKRQYGMSILTTSLENPTGYGRIIRDAQDTVVAIREQLDTTEKEKVINEINAGIYLFNNKYLFSFLKKIKKNPKKKEYYLTDIVEKYVKRNFAVGGFNMTGSGSVLGINDRVQLAQVQALFQQAIIQQHQLSGVTILDPANTFIEADVVIGKDTVVYPFTYIEKKVRIGSGCAIGPFCKIRSGSTIKKESHIGSFVEIVRSQVGTKTNIKHLSYIGDAIVGDQVNIGAGTITANYDGKKKNKTKIGNGAFIGSDTVLIAPVSIGENAKTGAGSIVPKNRNVPRGKTALGIPARITR